MKFHSIITGVFTAESVSFHFSLSDDVLSLHCCIISQIIAALPPFALVALSETERQPKRRGVSAGLTGSCWLVVKQLDVIVSAVDWKVVHL